MTLHLQLSKALFLFIFTISIGYTQCNDLFFSEYLEGSSNNKAIEIYNPTNSTVNLADYRIYRYNNGSSIPTDSLVLSGTLAPGAVYVAGNPTAIAAITSVSDTLHTITFFNGDDAMMLKKLSTNTILDNIGIIGVDPGVNWSVGSGATSEFTLVRMMSVNDGTTNWAVGTTQWDVHPQNTTTFLGSHSMIGCCINTTSSISPSSCGSYTTPSGALLSTSGTYNDTISNEAGCDSVITINLTINATTTSSISPVICGTSYTSPSGMVLSTSGTYNDTISNVAGCDSVITINLTIGTNSTSSISPTSCGSYTAPSGAVFTSNGTYNDTIPNATGCDSIITINLTINALDNSVTVGGASFLANQSGATYQWVNCDSVFSPISGATNQTYTPSDLNGYAVTITLGSCIDTSDCYFLFSIDESPYGLVQVYPNPVQNYITISFENEFENNLLTILTMDGKVISTTNYSSGNSITHDVSALAKGVYILKLSNEKGSVRQMFVKQ